MEHSGSDNGCGKGLCVECKTCKQETNLPEDKDQYSGCTYCAQCTVCTLVSFDQLHTNPTEVSPAHPVGVYGKRMEMYDSVGKMTFSMKYYTSRQEKFQIYGEEENIEVNEIKIIRAVKNNRGIIWGSWRKGWSSRNAINCDDSYEIYFE